MAKGPNGQRAKEDGRQATSDTGADEPHARAWGLRAVGRVAGRKKIERGGRGGARRKREGEGVRGWGWGWGWGGTATPL